MVKARLDLLMVERGLAESRSQAQRLVMAGQVRVNGQIVDKPSTSVQTDADLVIEKGPRYVSRGGEKLEAGLRDFDLDVRGLVCADVGASTGGFTDCLLQHGASRVYAIDVGQGILEWKLRQNPQVVVMEGTNARHVQRLPETVDLVTIDASFISLKILLPVIVKWFRKEAGIALALVKPQFEAGKIEASRGKGVIRDEIVHRQVLVDVLSAAQEVNFQLKGLVRSPLVGPKGNVEFLTYLAYPAEERGDLEQYLAKVGLEPEDAAAQED
jgi:23S rRNA (cytidine1920-2'-O)/16S rRNA (cytidine1409-2'-O)-methyltransferase